MGLLEEDFYGMDPFLKEDSGPDDERRYSLTNAALTMSEP